jgi:plastocyanin
MKKNNTFFILAAFVLFLFALRANSTTWTVTVRDFQFTPNNFNAVVGDTVKWQWINGSHTTTSLTVPSGAAPWDHAMNVSSQTFKYVITTAGAYHYKCTPHFPSMVADFTVNPNGIISIEGEVPQSFSLKQNYPNPFNPVTDIKFDVPKASFVMLNVMNILGQQVEQLVNEQLQPGSYKVDWNASGFPSGVYIYKMTSGDFTETKRMILIK